MTTTLIKPDNTALKPDTINTIAHKTAEGITGSAIARQLGISQGTVSKYVRKPEVKELTERLKLKLQNKYATRFIARKIKEEQTAHDLVDYALGKKDNGSNKTMYNDINMIEKYLDRQDKAGLKIMQGVSILAPNAMPVHIGDVNNTVVITPSYQAFLDYQSTIKVDDSELIEANSGENT